MLAVAARKQYTRLWQPENSTLGCGSLKNLSNLWHRDRKSHMDQPCLLNGQKSVSVSTWLAVIALHISSTAADAQPDHAAHFELCGKLVALALLHRETLPAMRFTPVLWKLHLGGLTTVWYTRYTTGLLAVSWL